MGSETPAQCIENQVSAILSAVTFSNLCCLAWGEALVQLRVLLLLILAAEGRPFAGTSLSDSPCFGAPLILWGELRSLDDLECSSFELWRWARALAGVLRACGSDSSSIVLPRFLVGDRVRVKFRREMPWRCRSLRFYILSAPNQQKLGSSKALIFSTWKTHRW